jgi:hypothetical protein
MNSKFSSKVNSAKMLNIKNYVFSIELSSEGGPRVRSSSDQDKYLLDLDPAKKTKSRSTTQEWWWVFKCAQPNAKFVILLDEEVCHI